MLKKNKFSICVALLILFLSLTSSENFGKIHIIKIPGIDKVAHFGMYFLFMSVILFENRKKLMKIYSFFLAALIPFFFGIIMELLQFWLTSTLSGDLFDELFNLLGILTALILFLILRSRGVAAFRY